MCQFRKSIVLYCISGLFIVSQTRIILHCYMHCIIIIEKQYTRIINYNGIAQFRIAQLITVLTNNYAAKYLSR